MWYRTVMVLHIHKSSNKILRFNQSQLTLTSHLNSVGSCQWKWKVSDVCLCVSVCAAAVERPQILCPSFRWSTTSPPPPCGKSVLCLAPISDKLSWGGTPYWTPSLGYPSGSPRQPTNGSYHVSWGVSHTHTHRWFILHVQKSGNVCVFMVAFLISFLKGTQPVVYHIISLKEPGNSFLRLSFRHTSWYITVKTLLLSHFAYSD